MNYASTTRDRIPMTVKADQIAVNVRIEHPWERNWMDTQFQSTVKADSPIGQILSSGMRQVTMTSDNDTFTTYRKVAING
jgi:uncharacterized FAD-dependent dehydrogenase